MSESQNQSKEQLLLQSINDTNDIGRDTLETIQLQDDAIKNVGSKLTDIIETANSARGIVQDIMRQQPLRVLIFKIFISIVIGIPLIVFLVYVFKWNNDDDDLTCFII